MFMFVSLVFIVPVKTLYTVVVFYLYYSSYDFYCDCLLHTNSLIAEGTNIISGSILKYNLFHLSLGGGLLVSIALIQLNLSTQGLRNTNTTLNNSHHFLSDNDFYNRK